MTDQIPEPAGNDGDADMTALTDGTLPEEARQAILRLIEEIDALRRELKANNERIEELEHLADADPLTPLVNRRAFVREIDRARAYVDRYGGTSILIYLDIDGLKRINDGHGHGAGDRALVAVATLLIDNVRSSDLVGRLGGDEFGVLMARASRKDAEEKVAALAALIEALRLPLGDVTDGGTEGGTESGGIALSASFGIAEITGKMDAEAALNAADTAMYAEKQRKKAS
tara:strand:+ start:570 stop:1259 length:690 start_codon:yes stop_codon:yes gene_type:complete